MSVVLGVMLFEGLIFLAAIAIIVVLIVKRVKEKKNETFEKRDN